MEGFSSDDDFMSDDWPNHPRNSGLLPNYGNIDHANGHLDFMADSRLRGSTDSEDLFREHDISAMAVENGADDSDRLQSHLHWSPHSDVSDNMFHAPHTVPHFSSNAPQWNGGQWRGDRPTLGGLTQPTGFTGPAMGLTTRNGPPVRHHSREQLLEMEQRAQIEDMHHWNNHFSDRIGVDEFMQGRMNERLAMRQYIAGDRRADSLRGLTDFTHRLQTHARPW